ncbi:RraA family protein [Rathayibacter sp. SD072]|uniref:RraA family protein n=1 Tax=Rathayibacter sp. SD072 TaxID=2781731 RepID=UPI001A965615|nr:RraA family protein [Rathayibacter sp. SD072]MBO0982643.1 RraA family protein [Rathayibacter sp. SD072]
MSSDNVTTVSSWQRPDADLVAAFARYPVANIGDAAERLNIVDGGIHPIWNGARAVGTALPVMTVAGDNRAVIDALEYIRPGDLLMINAFGFHGRAIIGDNLAQRFEFFGASGAVVDGYVRDRDIIESLGFPVFARGLTPAGPFKNGPGTIGEPVAIGGVVVNAGDIVVADSDGVIVIRPDRAREILRAVEEIAVIEAEKDAEVAAMRALRASHTDMVPEAVSAR